MDSALPATPWVILNFMIPPTRVDRLLATPYRHTCPTISSFFTVIYTANLLIELVKNQFAHRRLYGFVPFIRLNFRMTYTIAWSRFNTQTSTQFVFFLFREGTPNPNPKWRLNLVISLLFITLHIPRFSHQFQLIDDLVLTTRRH